MEIHPKDNEKFLSTQENWDLVSLVESLPITPVSTCLILVEPSNSKTGLLEERGLWILNFWQNILEHYPSIQGQRFNWSGLIFFSVEFSSIKMIEVFSNLLRNSTHPELQSKAIFSNVQNSPSEKLREIEQMELQLNKINYWNEHIYPSYFEDGIEKFLNSKKES